MRIPVIRDCMRFRVSEESQDWREVNPEDRVA
jgi:hypothetical protein